MEPVNSTAIRAFLQQLSERYLGNGTLYLLGGSALCLLGSPRETRDIDYTVELASGAFAQFESIVADYARAIELDPNDAKAFYNRGNTHYDLKDYPAALADYARAIELFVDNDWYYYKRSQVYRLQGESEQAHSDLLEAIRLAQQEYDQNPEDWRNTFNLALYRLVAAEMQEAERLYKQGLFANAAIDKIRDAIQDLSDLLEMFPNHSSAEEMRSLLQSHLSG